MTEAQGQPTQEAEATQEKPQGTFTQADLNKIAANEKREGRTARETELLQATGAESIDDLVAAYEEYQGIQEAVTTEADRANAKAEKLETRAKAAEERYTNTLREYALRDSLRDAGINPERLKGAMRLADLSALEVDADGNVTGIEDVVSSVREEAPEFFGTTERPRVNAPQTSGTGIARADTSPTAEQLHAGFLANLLNGG